MSLTFDRMLNFYETAAFGPLLAAAPLLSLAAGAAGTAISAAGTIAAGNNAAALGRFQNAELQEQQYADVSTGQRKMLEQQRQTQLVQSQLVARGAANGIDPSQGSTANLSSQIAGRGEYNALMDLSQSQNAANGLENQGSADLYQGNLSKAMAPTAAFGSIASGASSMFQNIAKNPQWFG